MVKVTTVSDMDGLSGDRPEPPNLRFLRILVTVLTAVMIAGVIAIVAVLVTRLNRPSLVVPDALSLPEGAVPLSITQGPGWWAVATADGRLLIFDREGRMSREIAVDLP